MFGTVNKIFNVLYSICEIKFLNSLPGSEKLCGLSRSVFRWGTETTDNVELVDLDSTE